MVKPVSEGSWEGFDRVTNILNAFTEKKLANWKISKGEIESNRISKIAMNIGTNVDEFIRAEINGEKAVKLKTVEAENCVKAWEKWKVDYDIDSSKLKTIERLFCKVTGVTGEPDIIIPFQEEVLDIKCSGGIRQKNWIQTNWYAEQLKLPMRSILRLDKNLAIYEYERRPVCQEDSDVFKALTVVYRYFKQFEKEEDL